MKRKKIGFFHGNDTESVEDPFSKAIAVKKAQIKQFIDNCFTPSGVTESREFKSSAELIYMLREFDNPSMKLINEIMNESGYQLTFIAGVPNWIVYIKNLDFYLD
ncbi:hypothetical protein M2132_001813 [Dysgonomonas sp. PH5-45]|uniref:hypothetical protein n=1 Tax=unclassified Dysgonomonas TaxID=2630389 RepID=UPI0024752171|nr:MULTISPECIES: hypothetical protein [unclassified Dysgonomonas]MDH6355470.1 hypothetical protein [Dysgonomonas sp. PH5-45]MDH6388366.1 hypothetical protein [Dysgonomonas sp. PH5-37]